MNDQRRKFQENCIADNGLRSATELACGYCPEGTKADRDRCVVAVMVEEKEESDQDSENIDEGGPSPSAQDDSVAS